MSIEELRARLADLPGSESLTMQTLGGRELYSISGKVVGTPIGASIADAEAAIRAAIASPEIVTSTPVAEKPIARPVAAPGSFAASIQAMMAEARDGVAQARAEGLAKVNESVSKLKDAKVATTHVTSAIAKTMTDEADAVMSELGQISNDFGLNGEAS
jgi:hypothetical protein